MSGSLTGRGPLFIAAEVDVYQPATGTATSTTEPWGVLPWATLSATPTILADESVLRASDFGYVTRSTDAVGLLAFPPILLAGVEIDRQLELEPSGQGAAAGWGSLRLANADDSLTALALSRNADGRDVRLRIGRKTPAPYGWRDPPWADTRILLTGIAADWLIDERELRLALRDPTYWIERPVDSALYGGTGGLDGGAALSGKRKPRLRGGNATDPVREIAPVLVDSVAGIYQVSDAPGGIVSLAERGLTGGIAFAGSVADITAASPPAGTYRVESSSRGLFLRLGTFPPAGQITVNAWGAFPDGTAASVAASVALEFLRQDLGVPATLFDAVSFGALAVTAPWTAGMWLGVDEGPTGVDIVGSILRSSAARLVPRRDGRLAAISFGPVPANPTPLATFTVAEIISCTPKALRPPLSPPPYRIRVGWGRHYTVQTSDLAPTLSGNRIQDLAEVYRVASASDAAVTLAWRRPSDPPLVETALTNATHAAALASLLRSLWVTPTGRRLYDITVPLPLAIDLDLGDIVSVTYPGPLNGGAFGRIVGEQIRTIDNVATLTVLV